MRTILLAALVLWTTSGASFAASDAPWTVETDQLAVTLGRDSRGAIVSLVDRATGRDLVAGAAEGRLFELEFSKAGSGPKERLVLSNQDAQQVTAATMPDQKAGLQLRFSQFAAGAIEVRCSVCPLADFPGLGWRIEADFPSSLTLEAVRFPIVSVTLPAGETPDDAVVLGSTKGGIFRGLSAYKPGHIASAAQPGSLAAQMACYTRPELGLLTAALDNRGYRKTITAARTAQGVLLVWLQPCFATSRFVQEYDLVLSTFHSAEANEPTDWRDGADLYKRWAVAQPWCRRTLAARDDLPAWLKSGPAMVRFSRSWLADPATVEGWLQDYWKKQFPAETPLILAFWGWEKIDTWITPDYFPVFPSDERFRQLSDFGRKLGAHTFLWPSGYHYTLTYRKLPSGKFAWDDRERFDRVARPHAVVGRDGQVLVGDRSWLVGGQTATMCAGDPWTIDWFNQISVGLAERGAELIQVDQVVGCNFPPCYSTEHGHPAGPGLWMTEAVRRQLQTMLEQCRAVQPEAVVCFEEPNEHFLQEVGLQDYRDWEALQNGKAHLASVFNYLYHEYLPTFQSNPHPGNRLQAAHCLVDGQIPHLSPSMHSGPGPLLLGGDFERWRDTAPAGWGRVAGYQGRSYTGEAAADKTQPHGGSSCLRLHNEEADQIVQVAQNVNVGETFAAGRNYRLRAWMKSSGLSRPNAITLGAFTGAMKGLGSWHVEMPKKEGDWMEGEARFTLPEGTELLRIMLQLNGPGTVWLDDVTLEEIGADGSAVVVQRPPKPDDYALMRQWVELFHGRGRPYLFLGRMLHPPRLEVETITSGQRRFPAILHNAFAAEDGSQAVVLVNATDTPRTGKLTWKGQQREIALKPWEVQLLSDSPSN